MEAQQKQFELDIKKIKDKLSESSKEIVDGYKQEIADLNLKLTESVKAKNKLLDEKLKIEEIIDKQIEQVDYWSNKANKIEDELSLRKQLEESVTQNLKKAEEQIRILKLEKEEKTLWSFKVKFINIEEAKSAKEILTPGTVQTWQSLHENLYFLRLTYTSNKDKLVKSFKVDADWLGGIIPITETRAAIQWKSGDGKMVKKEVEIDDPEQLLLEIGNITYR